MIEGGCHCGQVRFTLAHAPTVLKRCNCSICTKLGSLCGYCPPDEFRISAGEDGLSSYCWGDRMIDFRFCGTCGCHVHWRARPERFGECFPEGSSPRIGYNARLIEGLDIQVLPVDHWDGRSA